MSIILPGFVKNKQPNPIKHRQWLCKLCFSFAFLVLSNSSNAKRKHIQLKSLCMEYICSNMTSARWVPFELASGWESHHTNTLVFAKNFVSLRTANIFKKKALCGLFQFRIALIVFFVLRSCITPFMFYLVAFHIHVHVSSLCLDGHKPIVLARNIFFLML